jgi:hypothetical protein
METDSFIQALADTAVPVRPLAPPRARTAGWFAVAASYIALVVYAVSPRPDLLAKLGEVRYLIEQLAALATGVSAGLAAFTTIVPGRNPRVVLFPVLPLALWLGSLAQGCVQTWVQVGASGLFLEPDWLCFPAIVLVGAVPAITMAVMLRRGAPLTPHVSTALGGLAAAALGNFGLRLFHPQDASLMVLVWQVGAVFILTAASASAGRFLLNWR